LSAKDVKRVAAGRHPWARREASLRRAFGWQIQESGGKTRQGDAVLQSKQGLD